MSLNTKLLQDERNQFGDCFVSDSQSWSRENNLWLSACNLFDEMDRSNFNEWRSPNRTLEVSIHRVCYPITEFVLHQVFGSFGGVVEQILVIGGADVVMASVVFDSVEVAADAYGELYGRNIYDGCCQMQIKWGLPTPAARGAEGRTSVASVTQYDIDSLKPTACVAALAPSTVLAPAATPSAAVPVATASSSTSTMSSSTPASLSTAAARTSASTSAAATAARSTAPAPSSTTVASSIAPTASPSTTSSAAATISTLSDTIAISSGSKHATTEHIITEDDISTTNTMPARCSPVGRSHDVRAPAPVSTAVTAPPSPTATAATVTDNMTSRCLTDCFSPEDESIITMQRRYITNLAHVRSREFVLLGTAIESDEDHKLSADMIGQSPLVPANLVTTRPCFSLGMSFGSDQEDVNLRQSWPPFTASDVFDSGKSKVDLWFEMLSDSVQLRPSPWPSFSWQTIKHASDVLLAACKWDCRWLMASFIQWSFRNRQWKIPWFPSLLVCWCADAIVEVKVITKDLSGTSRRISKKFFSLNDAFLSTQEASTRTGDSTITWHVVIQKWKCPNVITSEVWFAQILQFTIPRPYFCWHDTHVQVLNKQSGRSMVDIFLWLFTVQMLSKYVFAMELLQEHML